MCPEHPVMAPDQSVLDLETWNEPPRRPPGPAAVPVVAVDGFEGPLDWLLDLARTRRIDLARLSIIDLVVAFEGALTTALAVSGKGPLLLAHWGEWLVMAAELTLLRSRLLVPADPADARAARDDAERLRQGLLGRVQTGRAADWLDGRPQVGRDVFLRGMTDEGGVVRPARTGDITALLRACLPALRMPTVAGARFRVPGPPVWSVADAIARIRGMLPDVDEAGLPLAAFLPGIPEDAPERDRRCRTAVSATFLAGLELARDGSATLRQDEVWETIKVSRVRNAEAVQA